MLGGRDRVWPAWHGSHGRGAMTNPIDQKSIQFSFFTNFGRWPFKPFAKAISVQFSPKQREHSMVF